MKNHPELDKLSKLFNLAERGEGGERRNAQAALERLLRRENLTMADAERMLGIRDHPQKHQFSYANPYEFRLLTRIIDHLVADWDGNYYRYKGSRSKCSFLLTPAQFVHAAFLYEALKPELAKALDEYTQVFAWKNSLRPNRDLESPAEEVDTKEALRLESLFFSAKRVQIRRQLKK